ncbi:50S ribosomal protein L18 [Candidatus Parcubacteria bacterium]|nr:50S ribosomal protein L18 [Candidatus Parcubacteria bacterium]
MLEKQQKRVKRHKKIRARIKGTKTVPRLSVFRSNKHIYAQLIDDEKGKILITAKDNDVKKKAEKTVIAREIGKLIAEKALEKKIKKIIFDRGGFKYHGRVKALAEGAREGGLQF